MPDTRPSPATPPSYIAPEQVAGRSFPLARRGFDPAEVRRFLDQVASELSAVRQREAELRARLQAAEDRAAHPRLDEATLTAALGQETARILRSAHDAASDITVRAEAEADRLAQQAREEASRIRERAESLVADRTQEAEAAAAEIRRAARAQAGTELAGARHSAESMLAGTREECREVVREAQEVRARTLGDLTRRRRLLHTQVEQLRAARVSLTETVEGIRKQIDAVYMELKRAEDDARSAADAALRKAAVEEPEVPGEARLDGPPHPSRGTARQTSAVSVVPADAAVQTSAPSRQRAPDPEPAASGSSAAPSPPDAADAPTSEVPPAVAPTAFGLAGLGRAAAPSGPAATPTSEAAPAPSSEAAPTPTSGPAGSPAPIAGSPAAPAGGAGPAGERAPDLTGDEVAPGVRVLRQARVAPPRPADAVPAADEGVRILGSTSTLPPPAQPGPRTSAVPPTTPVIDAPRAASLVSGDDVSSRSRGAVPQPDVQSLFARIRQSQSTEPGHEAPERPMPEVLLQRRDELIEPIASSLVRKLKRILQDDQSEVLDRLRTGASPSLPPVGQLLERARSAAAALLADAARAGVAMSLTGDSEPPEAQAVATGEASRLARDLIDPLRDRLDRQLRESAEDDPATVADRVSASYRESRSQQVPRLASDHVVAAFSMGVVSAVPAGTPLRWILCAERGSCEECASNATATPVAQGSRFPSGHQHPPAHAECRCLLLPAE